MTDRGFCAELPWAGELRTIELDASVRELLAVFEGVRPAIYEDDS